MGGGPHQRERAQSMTEVALCLPILCVLLVASAQYGVMIWRHMELTSATRDGARRAATARQESNPSALAKSSVLASLDRIAAADTAVTVSGGWNRNDTVTVTATTPYTLDVIGFTAWSGNLRSTAKVRIG